MSRGTWQTIGAAGAGIVTGIVLILALPPRADGQRGRLPLDRIKLPAGFTISEFARVPGARSMTLGAKGTLFVGTRGEGKVYAVVDADSDGRADRVVTIAEGLDMPNGVAFRDGSLYVAEVSRVIRFDDIESRLDRPPKHAVVNHGFPNDRGHGWKFIAFAPDGMLYVPVGMPCNICEPKDRRHGTIMRMKPDGSDLEVYARGIRNTVGFDWRPATGDLWFTDNGRDWMGDDRPPDELNRATTRGEDFGFPYFYGNNQPDPHFDRGRRPRGVVPPVQELGPHVAALGMRFYTGRMFPDEYRNQVFIAEHGSWNRTHKIGYRVMLVRLDDNGVATSYQPFAEGWLDADRYWGRPVDVQVAPDGALLVSDDAAGSIYRIAYLKPGRSP